jgi:hypothetical protein
MQNPVLGIFIAKPMEHLITFQRFALEKTAPPMTFLTKNYLLAKHANLSETRQH